MASRARSSTKTSATVGRRLARCKTGILDSAGRSIGKREEKGGAGSGRGAGGTRAGASSDGSHGAGGRERRRRG